MVPCFEQCDDISHHLTWYVSSLCPVYPHCMWPPHMSSCLSYQIDCPSITVLVFKQPLFYLIMAPECKSSYAGNSDMPKNVPLSLNVCMYRNKQSIYKVQYFLGFQPSTRGLGTDTPQVRKDYCSLQSLIHKLL